MPAHFDVVVVGGGIHGVGVAQACAVAGLSCCIVEQTDWAAGTSSRSSKLIHGGLRYLESWQWPLVWNSLHERSILLRIAPELVKPLRFLIPLYRDSKRPAWMIQAGLSLYSLLAGLTPLSRFQRISRSLWPDYVGLKQAGLRALFAYRDGQTDDAALTRTVLASAVHYGAQARCPCRLLSARGQRDGYRLQLTSAQGEESIDCRFLVNASGPWVNLTLAQITPHPAPLAVDLVQGSHLIIRQSLGSDGYYLEAPSDKRAVFALPWQGHTLLGTTETAFSGDPAEVCVSQTERDYLLATLRHYFPQLEPEIIAEFAGLRVLPRSSQSAFSRPRECILQHSRQHPRLLSIYGGKLTGYRHTAARVLRMISAELQYRCRSDQTAHIRLTGG